MSEWSIDGEARRLCNCGACSRFNTSAIGCRRGELEKGIRAGLAKAAEVAAINDACMVCSAVLEPQTHACCDDCMFRYDEAEDGSPVATADRIRALLK